jgi:hypothetical protein
MDFRFRGVFVSGGDRFVLGASRGGPRYAASEPAQHSIGGPA